MLCPDGLIEVNAFTMFYDINHLALTVFMHQVPSDIVGGEFRIWDPAVHNSSIFHEPVVPDPTQRLQIKVRVPTLSGAHAVMGGHLDMRSRMLCFHVVLITVPFVVLNKSRGGPLMIQSASNSPQGGSTKRYCAVVSHLLVAGYKLCQRKLCCGATT